MSESLASIKAALAACPPADLPDFIARYEGDDRGGAVKLLQTARRRYEAYEKELARVERMLSYERANAGDYLIAGIDEAGRGPLAGPVVAAAVILNPADPILYVNDSKQLSEKKREQLFDEIMDRALYVGVGMAEPSVIDEINILQADYQAMREAVGSLAEQPGLLLNDAVTIPGLPMRQIPIIKGDAKSLSIAAASIIAKVTRDRLMRHYDSLYPMYHFLENKGYGTAAHIEALKQYGPCPIHRRSFIGHFVDV